MYDMVILGGGPAGVTAALRARELGANVALVERRQLGGTCTNDGCVPTRVLAKAARLLRDAAQFEDYGIILDKKPTVDFPAILRRTQQVVYQMHEKKQLFDHLSKVQVEIFANVGEAQFIDPFHIRLANGTVIEGRRFVLCVGGSARRLNFPGSEYALTHSDVWTMGTLPQAVAIVGGGATGCQLASIFDAFGSQVTLIDVAPRILLSEDKQVAEAMRQEFERSNIGVITGIDSIEGIERADDKNLYLIYKYGGVEQILAVEAIILSIGWPGNTDGLNLPAAGVEKQGSYVKVNDYLQTTTPHIFAAGDITGRMMLVQAAAYQSVIAVENALLGLNRQAEDRLVPRGGFTDPEYGGVGLTEEQARKAHDCLVAVVPYADMDRAVIDGRTTGFCKLIVDHQSHLVIGAHVVGEQACEVVQMIAAGIAGGLRVEQLADLELAYPTFAAVVGLAARQIVRDMGAVPVSPQWRALKQIRGVEWERRD